MRKSTHTKALPPHSPTHRSNLLKPLPATQQLTSLAALEGEGEYISSDADVAEDANENIPFWCELDAEAGDTPITNRPDEVADAGDTGGKESGYTGCCCCCCC